MYDLAIIGGGPAGISAGIYASRKRLKTIYLTKDFGGQSIVSSGIENWIGEINIPGLELARKLEENLQAYAGDILDIQKGSIVNKIKKKDGYFEIYSGEHKHEAKSILIATGSQRRKLPALNADKFEHMGVTYCASCDGPFYKDKDVVVVGGGNSALESALQLSAYCNKVYVLHRRDEFRGDPVTVKTLEDDPKIEFILNAQITEVLGDKMVSGFKYTQDGEEKELDIDGIFVEVGALPATEFLGNLVELNESGHIVIDPWTQRTSVGGIWAAGDVTNILYHQNNIAAGDGVRALEDIYGWVKKQK
jgi:thioredoxin-disulfide reductase